MILNNSVFCKSFAYCTVYQGPNERTVYHNTGNGHYHQEIYIHEGEAEYWVSNDKEVPDALPNHLWANDVYDISHSKDKYVITDTNDVGCSMVMFNPVPSDKKLDIEVIRGELIRVIQAKDQRVTVVCITGPVTVKGKTLESMQYATVLPGNETTLEVPYNSICAVVVG